MPKVGKVILLLLVVYAGVVATFESLLGYFQPENQATLVITTFDAAGAAADRVLVRIEHEEQLYVAVNHWPRRWFHRLLDNDQVRVRFDGTDQRYRATALTPDEARVIDAVRPLSLGFRMLTGFPPRYFVRLTPVS